MKIDDGDVVAMQIRFAETTAFEEIVGKVKFDVSTFRNYVDEGVDVVVEHRVPPHTRQEPDYVPKYAVMVLSSAVLVNDHEF